MGRKSFLSAFLLSHLLPGGGGFRSRLRSEAVTPAPRMEDQGHSTVTSSDPGAVSRERLFPVLSGWLGASSPILQPRDFYAGGPRPEHLSRSDFVSLSIFPGYPMKNFSTTRHRPAVLEPEGWRQHWESSPDDSRSSLPCSLQSCLRCLSSDRTGHQGESKP